MLTRELLSVRVCARGMLYINIVFFSPQEQDVQSLFLVTQTTASSTHTCVHNTCTHTRTPPHTQGWAITLYENNQQQDVVMKLSYGFHPEADYFPIVAQPELLFLSYDIIKQKFILLQNHFLHSKKMS